MNPPVIQFFFHTATWATAWAAKFGVAATIYAYHGAAYSFYRVELTRGARYFCGVPAVVQAFRAAKS